MDETKRRPKRMIISLFCLAVKEKMVKVLRESWFFDVFPEKFTIKMDIQTLHYKVYYNKSYGQPTDDQTTTPIRFACLKESVFPAFIASGDKDVCNHWHNDIDDMVRCMFTQYGIGAKTFLGY